MPELDLLRARPVPVVLQHESTECGLACLAMIAAFHGRHAPLEQLRKQGCSDGRGATLGDLMQAAERMQLTSRPLRVALSELHRLRLPAVLHWRMNHFVVLVRRGRRRYLVHDPARGRRNVTRREFIESFTGVALELSPARGFHPQKKRRALTLGDFAGSFRHLWRYLGLMFCLLLCTQVLALAPPVATQILVDELVLGQDRGWLYRSLAGLGLIMLTGVMLDGLRRWISLYTGTRLAVDSSLGIMSHLFALPAEFINRRHAGDVMSKLESLRPIREALTDHSINCIVHGSVLITTLAIMFVYSGWLTAVSVGGFALSAIVVGAMLPASRRLQEAAIIHSASQNTSLVESLRACEVVQALGLEQLRLARWQKHFTDATNAGIREGKLAIAQHTGTGIVITLEQVLFLGVGIAGVLDKNLTLGVLFAFMSLRGRFSSAAAGLAETIERFFFLKVHTERLSDIALAEPAPHSPPGAITSTIRGSLKAERIAFRYAEHSWIVRDFSCLIEAGSSVVITGPSGCGKTTLLKLLAGHLPAASGRIHVDGRELDLWDRQSLRRQTAFVLQNDMLFEGTVAENISAFDMTPDLARVRAAAILAEVWAEIRALPMQLETRVSDMGKNLSGGQVQRLLLARALYRRPAILFLDEATSHLDVATEGRILDNIGRMSMTIISAAHRPDVIARAEKVIRLS